jgi:hypothetical protein
MECSQCLSDFFYYARPRRCANSNSTKTSGRQTPFMISGTVRTGGVFPAPNTRWASYPVTPLAATRHRRRTRDMLSYWLANIPRRVALSRHLGSRDTEFSTCLLTMLSPWVRLSFRRSNFHVWIGLCVLFLPNALQPSSATLNRGT